jgi:5-methylcytosine-specific restriction endonuclease McrA
MKHSHGGDYPPDWPQIALQVKEAAGWKCVRCGHPHDPASGHTLTVHHIDMNPANCAWWNLAALCQRCHLTIQAKVRIEQPYMLPHSKWFKPFVAGYHAHKYGWPEDKEFVMDHIERLVLL